MKSRDVCDEIGRMSSGNACYCVVQRVLEPRVVL
jgi:hypothetical protein